MNLGHEVVDFVKVSDVEISDTFYDRIVTGVDNLDMIFGGGIMRGSTITMIAKPGAGKSTFTLTLAELLTNKGYKIGYASGEEDKMQIAFTCKRLNVVNTKISTITDVDELASKIDGLDLLIVDSFQCITTKHKLTRIKKNEYIINNLVKRAKVANCAILFIVQLTSDGKIKGGTDLPYAVDANMEIVKYSKMPKEFRLISMYKNRFGAALDYGATLNEKGYTFKGELGNEDPDENVGSPTQPDEIVEYIGNSMVTLEQLRKHLDIPKKEVYSKLKELEKTQDLVKHGFGELAVWKKPNVDFTTVAVTILVSVVKSIITKKIHERKRIRTSHSK